MDTARQALINELMLDMIANTDCSWAAATAAVAFWEYHYQHNTAPVYGIVDLGDEKASVLFDRGKAARSLKVGAYFGEEKEKVWFITIQS